MLNFKTWLEDTEDINAEVQGKTAYYIQQAMGKKQPVIPAQIAKLVKADKGVADAIKRNPLFNVDDDKLTLQATTAVNMAQQAAKKTQATQAKPNVGSPGKP